MILKNFPGDLNAIWVLFFVVYYLLFFLIDFVFHYFFPRIYHIFIRDDKCPCNQLVNENNRPLSLRIFQHRFAVKGILFLVGTTLVLLGVYYINVPLSYVLLWLVIEISFFCAVIIRELRKPEHKTTYKVLV